MNLRYEHKYVITKRFVKGLLEGCTIKEKTSIYKEKGKIYKGIMSSDYLVLEVKET